MKGRWDMEDKTQPAYIPMPEDCGRGAQPVFDNVRHVDTVICYHYCTKQCETFFGFCEKWEAERKRRKKEASRKNSRKPRRQALELANGV